jgi:hypothetical protein
VGGSSGLARIKIVVGKGRMGDRITLSDAINRRQADALGSGAELKLQSVAVWLCG